ncbi:MAG: hypothetical protein ACMG6E_04540 [Candidatus Roizmanbacteria bacterium]
MISEYTESLFDDLMINLQSHDLFIELISNSTSLGTTTTDKFIDEIPKYNKTAMIMPIQDTFLTFEPPVGKIAVVGNLPFTKKGKDAIDYLNHAAKFSQVMAVFGPRTFRKPHIMNQINACFHLVYQEVNDTLLWMIWVHKDYQPHHNMWNFKKGSWREMLPVITHETSTVSFGTANQCTFMIRRNGKTAGKITWDREKITAQANSKHHYFVIVKHRNVDKLRESFTLENFEGKYDVIGQPSISKGEIIMSITEYLQT